MECARPGIPVGLDGDALYFGRYLGALVLIVEALILRAGAIGEDLVFTFQVLLAVAAYMRACSS